jgi:hypothetical protein
MAGGKNMKSNEAKTSNAFATILIVLPVHPPTQEYSP